MSAARQFFQMFQSTKGTHVNEIKNKQLFPHHRSHLQN